MPRELTQAWDTEGPCDGILGHARITDRDADPGYPNQ
jgi:hypothetical protein